MPDPTGSTAHSLAVAEERLRALGWTGAQAFDVLMDALEARRDGSWSELDPRVRDAVDPVPTTEGLDVAGLAYERFFPDLFKGRHGQYFTPPTVARLLVERLCIRPGESVLDPACGAGSLLARAKAAGARIRGIERDPRLARLARLGLGASVLQGDMFATPPEPVDVVVANPPFSVPVRDPAVLDAHDWPEPTALSDQLFAALLTRWVRPGGRAGVVMPASLLSNRSFASTREVLDAAFTKTAICLLPEGVFRPFGGAAGRAVVVWLRRRDDRPSPPDAAAWARLDDPGYDPRSMSMKPTSTVEVDARIAGEGWETMPEGAWHPTGSAIDGQPLADLASVRTERAPSSGMVQRLDLGDVDPHTGEALPTITHDLSGRRAMRPGDVLVSRLRPERGNVTVAPPTDRPLVGSPEWIVLDVPRVPHWVWLVLRTEAWRAQLPVPAGQTRPRTSAEAVLQTRVPWRDDAGGTVPAALVDRVDDLAADLLARRAALSRQLRDLQDAVESYVEDRDSHALSARIERLEDEG